MSDVASGSMSPDLSHPPPDHLRSSGELDRSIGTIMKSLRTSMRLPQKQIAAALGVSFQQVQKYENGSNRMSVGTFILFCHCLSREPADILSLAGAGRGETADAAAEASLLRNFHSLPPGQSRAQLLHLADLLVKAAADARQGG